MSNETKEIPVEVKNTTVQINSILAGIELSENTIKRLEDEKEKYKTAVDTFNSIQADIDLIKKHNKEKTKLVESLVGYVKDNYNEDFTPGPLFNQTQKEQEN